MSNTKYQVRYMNDAVGEQLATNLTYEQAQALVREVGNTMHIELAADLQIKPIAPDLDDYEQDGQPSEYEQWQDYMGGDDWDHGQYDY